MGNSVVSGVVRFAGTSAADGRGQSREHLHDRTLEITGPTDTAAWFKCCCDW